MPSTPGSDGSEEYEMEKNNIDLELNRKYSRQSQNEFQTPPFAQKFGDPRRNTVMHKLGTSGNHVLRNKILESNMSKRSKSNLRSESRYDDHIKQSSEFSSMDKNNILDQAILS